MPLQRLPPELLLEIFKALPCIRDITALANTTKKIKGVYEDNRKKLEDDLANEIINSLTSYLRFLGTLHVDPEDIISPTTEWRLVMNKTPFAASIMRKMPALRYPEALTARSDFHQHGAGEIDDIRAVLRMQDNQFVNIARHLICLDRQAWLFIDTYRSEILNFDYELGPYFEWFRTPISEFFEQQRQRLLNKEYYPPIGVMDFPLYPGDSEKSDQCDESLEDLITIFEKWGWPHSFRRAEAVNEIRAYYRWRWG